MRVSVLLLVQAAVLEQLPVAEATTATTTVTTTSSPAARRREQLQRNRCPAALAPWCAWSRARLLPPSSHA